MSKSMIYMILIVDNIDPTSQKISEHIARVYDIRYIGLPAAKTDEVMNLSGVLPT